MKKFNLLTILVLSIFMLVGCGGSTPEPEEPHEHTFSEEWVSDMEYHWNPTTCGHNETRNKAPHSWDEGVITLEPTSSANGMIKYTCTVCDAFKEDVLPPIKHEHKEMDNWIYDEYTHTKKCECGEILDKGNHVFDDGKVVKEPTESQDGIKEYTCYTCNYKKQEVVTYEHQHTFFKEWSYDVIGHWHAMDCGHDDYLGDYAVHKFDEGVITKAPTETEQGEKTFTCYDCKYELKELIPALPVHHHEFAQYWVTDEKMHYRPATCGCDVRDSEGEHTWDAGVVTVEPTIHIEGVIKYTCTTCEYFKLESLPKHEHEYSTVYSKDENYHWFEATCGCNEVKDHNAHQFDEGFVKVEPTEYATGIKEYTCSVCNYVKQEILPIHIHTLSDTYESNNIYHWKNATCEHNDYIGELAEHVYEDKVLEEATCGNGGKLLKTCYCGYSYEESTEPTYNHQYEEYVEQEANCSQSGIIIKTCSGCGDTYPELTDPTEDHDLKYEIIWLDDYTYALERVSCSRCPLLYDSLKTQTEINITKEKVYCTDEEVTTYSVVMGEHTYKEEVVTKQATNCTLLDHAAQEVTCTQNGWEAYQYCIFCSYSTFKEIEAEGHKYEDVVVKPTCSEGGYTIHKCGCGLSYNDTEVNPLGHEYIYVNSKQPTCTEEGNESYIECERCFELKDLEEKPIIPALGHLIEGNRFEENLVRGQVYDIYYQYGSWNQEQAKTGRFTTYHNDADLWVEMKADVTITISFQQNLWWEERNRLGTFYILTEEYNSYENPLYSNGSLHNQLFEDTDEYVKWESITLTVKKGEKIMFMYVNSANNERSHFNMNMSVAQYDYLPGKDFTEVRVTGENYNYLPDSCIEDIECLVCDGIAKASLGHDWIDVEYKEPTCLELGNEAYHYCNRCSETTYKAIDLLQHSYKEDSEYCENCNVHKPTEGILYELSEDGSYYLASGIDASCSETELYFDNHHNNKVVLGVKENAFKDNTTITKVSFPKEYLYIKENAFKGCTSLESVEIFDHEIHYTAFDGAPIKSFKGPLDHIHSFDVEKIENVIVVNTYVITQEHFNKTYYTDIKSLKLLEFDSTVSLIESDTFKRFTSIEKVNYTGSIEEWSLITFENEYANPCYISKNLYINDELLTKFDDSNFSISEVFNYAFYGVESLKEVVLNNITINEKTFINSGINKLHLGKTYSNFDIMLFQGTSLETLTVDEGNENYYSSNGNLLTKNKMLVFASEQFTGIDEEIKSIGANAFMFNNDITELTVPNGVVVRAGGLAYLSKLKSLTIAQLGSYTLDNQEELILAGLFGTKQFDSTYWVKVNNVNYFVPLSLTRVEVTGTARIHAYAFYGCGQITEIILNDNISEIQDYAFAQTSITELTLPSSLYYAGKEMLAECDNLVKLVTPFVGKERNGSSDYHLNYFFGKKQFSGSVVNDYGYHYPQTFTDIELTKNSYKFDFSYCTTLKNVVLPNDITIIYENTFKGCTGITEITIPDSVTSIHDSAFEGCTGLQTITIPRKVDFFGNNVFKDCTNLQEVNYLAIADSTGRNMFAGCTLLQTFHYPETLKVIESYTFKDCINLKEFEVLDTVLNINNNAFENCVGITSLYIPDNTLLGLEALAGCSGLQTLNVPSLGLQVQSSTTMYSSIKHWFGDTEFEGSYVASSTETGKYLPLTLTNVIVRGGKITLNDISYCKSINNLDISGVSYINQSALAGLSQLDTLTIPFIGETENSTSYKAVFGYIFGSTQYEGSVELTQYYTSTNFVTNYIPSSLKNLIITKAKSLQFGALSEVKLESILLDFDNLAYIDANALINTEGLSTITENNCVYLGSLSNPYTLLVDVVDKTVTELIISDKCTNIGGRALSDLTNLTDLVIPNSVKSIGANALEGCTALTTLSLPFIGESKEATNEKALLGYIFGNTENALCTLTSQVYSDTNTVNYYIPTSLSTLTVNGGKLSYGALSNCKKITSLTLNNITSIQKRALYCCSGLTTLEIPTTVTSIGFEALNGAENIVSLVIPFIGSKMMDHTVDEASEESLFGYIFGTTSFKATATATQRYSATQNIKYYIPSTLKSITVLGGDILYGAFSGLYNGKFNNDDSFSLEITLGKDVTYIGDYAFAYSYWDNSENGFGSPAYFFRGLSKITFEGDLEYMGDSVFYNLGLLRHVNFNGSLDNLELNERVFNGFNSTVLLYADMDYDTMEIIKNTVETTFTFTNIKEDNNLLLLIKEKLPTAIIVK